ncbi:MAG: PAS domain S-box protein, partial [Bacteroidetes bacterium]|nr:PAS domain S-box protein [Bacteroidota bacterium]MBU1578386.1 PAS domain S-box protein [Bacteroidota bacterium]
KAKEKAEESEKLFKSLIKNAPDGIVIIDEQGKYTFVSPNAERLFGYNKDEAIGHSGSENTHPDDLPMVLKALETICADPDKKPKLEYRFKRKNGEFRWIETTFTNLLSDRAINGIVLNFSDITERKQIFEELLITKEKAEESERKFRLIGENTSDGIIVFNSNFQIIYVSPAYENQLGYSAKEEILRTTEGIADLIYPDDKDVISEIFKAIEEKKQGLIYSYRIKHKQGHYIWREDNAKFNYDSNNNYTGAYVVCRDITEKKIQEQQIIAAKEKAEQSDRLKSAFLANMSHEIRTPMNGILGFADLLKEPDLTGDEQQKYIGIIEKSGNRMLNIINDIIDISKIESGLMELVTKETNVNEQIEFIYTFF